MPYFQATQWDDPFTWCCGLVSLLTIGSTCTPSTACKKKNSHKIRVFTWNTWHTYWASYQREIKESSMKGGGGGEGWGEEEIGFRKQGFFRTFLRTRLTVTSVAGIFCTFVFRVSITWKLRWLTVDLIEVVWCTYTFLEILICCFFLDFSQVFSWI